jgi:4'-phosphopantetheinyl transferase EntD
VHSPGNDSGRSDPAEGATTADAMACSRVNGSAGQPGQDVKALFACEVAVAQGVPALVDDCLYDEEREYIAEAVPRRRAEFGTARVCARRALAELGFASCSLAPYPDRSPRWPEGAIGSISHTAGICLVAVALSSRASGIGLDVECDGDLDRELEAMICTPAERRWLDQWMGEERGRMAKLVFSAKEAFYKCQYPTTRSILDFLEVELHIDPDAGRFTVARVHRIGAPWRFIEGARGRLLRTEGIIVTAATL